MKNPLELNDKLTSSTPSITSAKTIKLLYFFNTSIPAFFQLSQSERHNQNFSQVVMITQNFSQVVMITQNFSQNFLQVVMITQNFLQADIITQHFLQLVENVV